ncbi:helix-turn-helix transcriptional regulator [Saccharopolyspora phatthalungensis]|uniref:DNA-binding NarL/FixJ family response regulator n=1 Tax=Saccharopolyspora phatthalungensis TaxID=664693 RepID=A0A840QJ69_9PSEU|nr:response regulator transcription factor [Saccharopolyspora phatthalungensis]MBB5158939.1 DNA-binding NarL/FixJ family response regulator [Saccharopolyspora phatthalungensis]
MDGGTTAKIRVAIFAPNPLTRAGLAQCLDQQQHIQTTFEDAEVLVVAMETAEAATLESLRGLRPNATTPLLLVVQNRWHADIATAVELGVRAILWHRQFSTIAFAQAIRAVGGGGGFLPASLQGALMEQVQRTYRDVLAPQDMTASGVTNRETDVLRLVSEGFDLEEIAQKLHFSERTIKNILYKFMKRFDLNNRTHAVAYAIRAGLI